MADYFFYQATILWSNDELMVIGIEVLRNCPRMRQFVIRLFLKANREGRHRPCHLPAHQADNETRIDAATHRT